MADRAIKLLVIGESGVGKSRQVASAGTFPFIFNCVFPYTHTHTQIYKYM